MTPASAPSTGLSDAEANARLRTEGFNELPRPELRTPLRIAIDVLREPMLALLLGGGAVYLVFGDLQDALILLAFATLSVAITVVQESRTERVLEALRDLASPRALVIRDGKRKRIAGREVVRGDIVVLAEGDRIPADAMLVESHELQADESLLTGESVPVRKVASSAGASAESARPGGDDLPYVFSGSLVVRGTGVGQVVAIGALSEIGRIGQAISMQHAEPPRLQAQVRRLVRGFAVAGGAVSILVVVLYGTLRGGWLDAVLAGIAVGMSMLPEEFPVVLTVFMAMGAWRLSRARVLTRRAASNRVSRPMPSAHTRQRDSQRRVATGSKRVCGPAPSDHEEATRVTLFRWLHRRAKQLLRPARGTLHAARASKCGVRAVHHARCPRPPRVCASDPAGRLAHPRQLASAPVRRPSRRPPQLGRGRLVGRRHCQRIARSPAARVA